MPSRRSPSGKPSEGGWQTLKGPPSPPPDAQTREIIEGSELGFASILSARDVPNPVNIAESQLLWYWDTSPESGNPVAFLTLLQSQFRLQQTFLEKELPPGRKPADTGIFLFVLSGNADLRYPRDLKVRKELIALLEKVSLSGRPLQSAVRWKDRDYLIVGQPGKHLDRKSVV